MSPWDPYDIAGLTWVNQELFTDRTNQIALSGGGAPADGAVDGHFAYDDTVWGQVPVGVYATIATCAVNESPPIPGRASGRYVQLQLGFVDELGRDYTVSGGGTAGGQITAFHASMRGFGALDAGNEADGGSFASLLPWDTLASGSPFPFLLRPATLLWPGQDDNPAARTVWLQSEVDLFSFDFTVSSTSAGLETAFWATGWR